jgi:transcriptional regulator with XRE-family HTH domain
MPITTTPRTPEGRLIRRKRTAARISIPAAAKAAGISSDHWGNVERGTRSVGGQGQEDVTGTPATIALMARTVGVTADELTEAGRTDAAAELGGAPVRPEPELPEPEDELFIAAVIKTSPEDREVLEGIMRLQDGEGNPLPWPKRRELMESWLRKPDSSARQSQTG